MIKIDNVDIYGLRESVRASKFPFAIDAAGANDEVTETTNKLAKCAIGAGDDNFLNGVIVQFDLTCSLKMWTQIQRYHFIDFVSSQSTMHRITKFDIAAQCNAYVDERAVALMRDKVAAYDTAETAADRRQAFLECIYNIPSGFMLTARMTTNYRQLKTIYKQRRLHRLPEWREFCGWVERLPHSEWITGRENDNATD